MTDKNDHRLLSSAHSAVTPRQDRRPSLPKVSRQKSSKKHVHRRKTRSAKSMTVIHTNIRQLNDSASANRNKNAYDVDTMPSIEDLLKATHRRQNSTSDPNQSLNKSSNNTTRFAADQQRNQSSSRTHDDQRQIKSSTKSTTHGSKKRKILQKRLSKSAKVVPYNDDTSRGSTQFNSSSKTKITAGRSGRKRSTDDLRDITESTKKRKKRKRFCCTSCPCLLRLLIAGLCLGIILTALLLEFLPKSATTTTTTKINTSALSTNTSTAVGSSTTTSSLTTMTTVTTTTATPTTTTTHLICGFSCINQSWISSANLLAAWQFDNSLLEDVTNSNASAALVPSYVTGYVNQALLFDANGNQSVRSPTNIDLVSTSFTIDGWIYPTGFPNIEHHSIFGLCPKPGPDNCLYLTIHYDSTDYYLYFGFGGDDCPGNTAISLNEWIHVAFVIEVTLSGVIQSIYLNGNLDASRTPIDSFQGGLDIASIGDVPEIDSSFGSNYFQGWIDRLAISNRAKSSCEILEEATLSAYFSFNSVISLSDSGPNSLSAVGSSVSFVSTGHSLQAISFTGSTSSYFQISDVTSLGITNRAFSISLWVRPRSLSGTLVHVSANASGLGWCIPFLGFASNGSIVAQMLNGIVRSVIGPSIPVASSWTHIVETWNSGSGLRLYIDNVLVASTTLLANSYTASTVPDYVTLGNSLCGAGLLGSMSPYNGDIDEFRIYSRELTVDDICALYNS